MAGAALLLLLTTAEEEVVTALLAVLPEDDDATAAEDGAVNALLEVKAAAELEDTTATLLDVVTAAELEVSTAALLDVVAAAELEVRAAALLEVVAAAELDVPATALLEVVAAAELDVSASVLLVVPAALEEVNVVDDALAAELAVVPLLLSPAEELPGPEDVTVPLVAPPWELLWPTQLEEELPPVEPVVLSSSSAAGVGQPARMPAHARITAHCQVLLAMLPPGDRAAPAPPRGTSAH